MSSDVHPPTPTPGATQGLPPVSPPSGKLIVQLFVVPGLIVGLIVLLLLGVTWLMGGAQSPEAFLKGLDDPNPDVRWRAASDLAQQLPRNNQLASDVPFALELTKRLDQVIKRNVPDEKQLKEQLPTLSSEEIERKRLKLEADRDYIKYLTGCLGHLIVPVCAPILRSIATELPDIEPMPLAYRRRQALFALTNLGASVQRFDQLPAPEQEAILAHLEEASQQPDVSSWAIEARDYLRSRREGHPTALKMDQTIQTCALAEDPVLREHTTLCARIWYGTPAENERIEEALLLLSRDTGKGEDLRETLSGPDPSNEREILGRPGFIIQANAAIALASRGSKKTPLHLIQELLDPRHLEKMVQVEEKDNPESRRPDESKIQMMVWVTLVAVDQLQKKAPDLDLSPLRPLVENLTTSSVDRIKEAAQNTLRGLTLQAGEP